jgi:hypothetical protein
MNLLDSILAVAKSYLNQEETPNNSGFKNLWFQKLMISMGWYKGASWCAFTGKAIWYNGFLQADPIGAKLILKYATGSAIGTYSAFAKSKEFHVQHNPVVGGLVIFQDGNGPYGHEGVVTSLIPGGFTFTSGNTSVAGSREGTTVLDKPRMLNVPFNPSGLNLLGFVNPVRIA